MNAGECKCRERCEEYIEMCLGDYSSLLREILGTQGK